MQRSENINELSASLAKAQAAMKNPEFDKTNPHFRSRYATLAAVIDAVLPHLTANGLAIVQSPRMVEHFAGCEWILMHTSGQWVGGELMLPLPKNDAQAVGSCITYARRYSLQAVAGVTGEEDDDGNAASGGMPDDRQRHEPAKRKPPADAAPPKDSPEVVSLRKFFADAGCTNPDEQVMVARMGLHNADLAKAKADQSHAKAILDGLELALADYKRPAAILEAARNVTI